MVMARVRARPLFPAPRIPLATVFNSFPSLGGRYFDPSSPKGPRRPRLKAPSDIPLLFGHSTGARSWLWAGKGPGRSSQPLAYPLRRSLTAFQPWGAVASTLRLQKAPADPAKWPPVKTPCFLATRQVLGHGYGQGKGQAALPSPSHTPCDGL
jgi:hypothetical protein